ncbi:DUF7282 domain-containing protein [Nitratireductor luteus]|uniref:DUF7282 domain-containing protein n=1 Tax=Nitratireductor luteus TaxID=2976980 RepID=UPI00224080DF|nr:hypothetical protein [Nitratireductor luteus]
MRNVILTASAAMLLTGSAFAQTEADPGETDMAEVPAIETENAKIEGDKITGVSVTTNRPGYVVIHDNAAGAPPASLGHLRVEPGETEDLSIDVAGVLDPASGIVLMLHYETNDNHTYDFGPGATDVDTPAMGPDGPIAAEVPAM